MDNTDNNISVNFNDEKLPVRLCEGVLKIEDLSFPCAVLDDGERILVQKHFMDELRMYRTSRADTNVEIDGKNIIYPVFLSYSTMKDIAVKHFKDESVYINYYDPKRGILRGLRASAIPKICQVWVDAYYKHEAMESLTGVGLLTERQLEMAERAKTVLGGLQEVGIVALVDEATGYERVRYKGELAKIFEKYIAKELQPYSSVFPSEFYTELFRLTGYPQFGDSRKRPIFFANLTNDLVYRRLAPEILPKLKETVAKLSNSKKAYLHQGLTPEDGRRELVNHIEKVLLLMRSSQNIEELRRLMDRSLPKLESKELKELIS